MPDSESWGEMINGSQNSKLAWATYWHAHLKSQKSSWMQGLTPVILMLGWEAKVAGHREWEVSLAYKACGLASKKKT